MSYRVLILVAMWGSVASAADWPTYQRDHRRTGVTPERLAPPLIQHWVFRPPFPPAKGWARPVNGYGATKNASNVSFDDAPRVTAVGRMAYFSSSGENKVYAVDAAEGTLAWTFVTNAPPRLAPTVDDGRVYFGADDGTAYCLWADDGAVAWKVDCAPTDERMLGTGRFMSLWPLRTGVMVDRGTAYFTAGLFPSEGSYFYAADARNGRILWRRKLDRGGLDGPSPQGYLLASDDSIYMTSRVAPTRWSLEDGSPIQFATPIPHHEYRFHNGGSYAQLWNGNIVYGQAAILAYDPKQVLIDKYNRPQKGALVFNWFNARRVLFAGELAYVATDDYLMAVRQKLLPALARAECKQFEEAYKQHRVASYLTALEELARVGEDSPLGRRLQQTSLKWGKESFERWPAVAEELYTRFAAKCEWMVPLQVTEAMIMAGEVIYAGGEDQVVAVDAKTGKQLWHDRTGSRVRGLAVANGRLFVSTIDGNVRCYMPGTQTEPPKQVLPPASKQPYPKDELAEFDAKMAEGLVRDSGADRGYCLILAGGTGRLAYEVAQRTRLNVYVLEPDAEKVNRARRALTDAGLYGGRITVEQASLATLPFPPYVFNLVIDQRALRGGPSSTDVQEIFRVTKPCGGVAYVAGKKGTGPFSASKNGPVPFFAGCRKLVRGPVERSADWTHNYATAANTYCNEDPLVKGPLGILWYGEPGPRKRIERHAAPPVPLVVDGVMFLLGYDLVMAYDVYNGVPYWERTILGATRTGLPLGTSNLVADKTSLFVVVGDRECLRLDAETGRTIQTYPAPAKGADPASGYWGWIARDGNLLYGSRPEFDAARRRADPKQSEAVFALDVDSGRLQWTYDGAGIDHDGIAIAEGKLFLIDRNLTDAQRRQALAATVRDTSVPDRKAVDRRGDPIPPDLRKLVALDAVTGAVQWQKPLNLTDVTLDDTVVSGGRVGVACMVKDGVVVVHGTASLGHPYQEFVRGEFARRAIYAYDAGSGRFLWGGRRNYRKRPIIVGGYVYAEPHAWHLKTGEPKTYTHPVSGRQEPFDCFRGYIGCSHLLASGAALFGNKQGIAHWNLDQHCGYTPLGNMSLACGLGAVPAGGVYAAPEGRSGCTCDTPIFTSIVLYPRQRARAWSVGIPEGVSSPKLTPVRQVAINLGAPGFREDADGTLWIPYPYRDGGGILGDWLPTYQHDETICYGHSEDFLQIEGTDRPWVYTSGYTHTKPLSFKLIDQGQPPARYTVRLHFAEPEDLAPGQRVFDVLLQGKKVLEDFDVAQQAGGPQRALVKEFPGVEVSGNLVVALQPADGSPIKAPILCGIEAIRE